MESAVLGRPLVFGPGMGNFRVIAQELVAEGAAVQVPDAAALGATVGELLRDATRREALATAARAWHRVNSGALQRTLAVVREELGKAGV